MAHFTCNYVLDCVQMNTITSEREKGYILLFIRKRTGFVCTETVGLHRWGVETDILVLSTKLLKRKYHANLLSFQNPKMFVCQQKQQNNIVKFVINYHLSAIKPSISVSGQRQSRLVWIET